MKKFIAVLLMCAAAGLSSPAPHPIPAAVPTVVTSQPTLLYGTLVQMYFQIFTAMGMSPAEGLTNLQYQAVQWILLQIEALQIENGTQAH